jgi:NAD-dependent deacetylase
VIDTARRIIETAERIVSFSGAGLSAESGVGTFRDPDGLWARFDPTRLASPEGFADDPELVIRWYADRRRAMANARPNPAHEALARARDMVHVTQNVDGLLQRAGADAAGVIELHGTIAADRCHARCGHREAVDLADPPPLRPCPRCGAPMRPEVVWFGEALPAEAWQAAERDCAEADVMLVIGTSAIVYPAAGLISLARSYGAKIIIVNKEPSEASEIADIELLGKAGEIVPQLLE